MEQVIESNKKRLQGKVINASNSKTILVEVNTYRAHPIYAKRYRYTKKYQVHDEKNIAKVGDKVLIIETRPLSKTKHFKLLKIKERATLEE